MTDLPIKCLSYPSVDWPIVIDMLNLYHSEIRYRLPIPHPQEMKDQDVNDFLTFISYRDPFWICNNGFCTNGRMPYSWSKDANGIAGFNRTGCTCGMPRDALDHHTDEEAWAYTMEVREMLRKVSEEYWEAVKEEPPQLGNV